MEGEEAAEAEKARQDESLERPSEYRDSECVSEAVSQVNEGQGIASAVYAKLEGESRSREGTRSALSLFTNLVAHETHKSRDVWPD